MTQPLHTISSTANMQVFGTTGPASATLSTGGWSSLSTTKTASFCSIQKEVSLSVTSSPGHTYKAYNPAEEAAQTLYTEQPNVSTTGNKVWAYAPDRSTVVVSSSDLIKSATLYDITGRLITSSPLNSHLMTNTLTLHTAGTAGVYIVDVTLRDGSTERAQVIVQ